MIMHTMNIKNERANLVHDDLTYDWEGLLAQVDHNVSAKFENFMQIHREICDQGYHQRLQDDLVAHLWVWRGNTTWVLKFNLFWFL
jgi:hypothetical protein